MAVAHSYSKAASRLIWCIAVFVLFIFQLNIGTPPDGASLDASWSAVLAWGLTNNAVWGRDLVFTFGPLGFLHPGASYYAPLFTVFLTGQIIVSLVISMALTHVAILVSWPLRIGLLAVFSAWWLPWISPDVMSFLFLGSSAVAIFLHSAGVARTVSLLVLVCIYAAAAATMALIKFSFFPVAVLWVLVVSIVLATNRKPAAAGLLPAVYLVTTGLLWHATGQPFGAAGDHLSTSLEILSGYGGAMGIVPSTGVDLLGFSVMAGAGGWVGWQALAHRRDIGRAAVFILLGCIIFVAWRAGFTRADGHIVILYPVTFFLLLISVALLQPTHSRRIQGGMIIAILFASLAGMWSLPQKPSTDLWTVRFAQLPEKLSILRDPSSLRRVRESQRIAAASAHGLPRIRSLVGRDSVDILSWDQGVLLLNELAYQPRPIFQGYSVYTADLIKKNEEFFLGPRAPTWIILKLQAIDGRIPTADDALSLVAILRRYRPVMEEKGYMLWQRSAEAAPPPLNQPLKTAYKPGVLGEWIDVPKRGPDAVGVVFLDSQPSALGKLYAFWFRGAPLAIEVQTEDGRILSWRLIPAAAENGFVLSPLLLDNNDLLDWYSRSGIVSGVAKIRVIPMNPLHRPLFKNNVNVAFDTFSVKRPAAEQMPQGLIASVAAGFYPTPSGREGMIQRLVEDDEPSLFMHSPAALQFDVASGEYGIDGTFGIRSAVLQSAGCANGDGIRLAVYALSGSGTSRLLYLRDINPFVRPSERGAQHFSIMGVMTPAENRIALVIEPGPAGSNTDCDWAYVRNFRIRRIRMMDGSMRATSHVGRLPATTQYIH